MRLALATALALTGLTLIPTQAQATPTPCPSRYMTPAEFSRLELGMTPAQVTRIVGSFGKYARTDRSDAGRPVLLFVWDWCTDGSYYADQWLGFERSPAGVWSLTEIR
jgi:hypothetical protein